MQWRDAKGAVRRCHSRQNNHQSIRSLDTHILKSPFRTTEPTNSNLFRGSLASFRRIAIDCQLCRRRIGCPSSEHLAQLGAKISGVLAATQSGDWVIEIVKRNELHKFVVLPKRWIVERAIAWLNRCRRLAKDWENLNRKALAFLRLASIRLMLRKLCNPL